MRTIPFALGGLFAAPTLLATPAAAAGTISITIPRVPVAEYHKPYVAAWIEQVGGGAPHSLLAWYDIKKGGAEPGHKWLADLRSWWRKAGRTAKLPIDGVSGATRPPGSYTLPLPADLKPGQYVLNVEAAREGGGRELVSVPFSAGGAGRSAGKSELGAVAVTAR